MKHIYLKSWLLFWTSSYLWAGSMTVEPALLGVVNNADNTVSFINLETRETEFTREVGYLPHEITTSRDSKTVYVSNYGKQHVRSESPDNRPGNTLSSIDVAGGKVRNIELGPGLCTPHGIAASKTNDNIFLTCEGRDEILIVGQQTESISTHQNGSHMLALSPDESRVYVANFFSGSVTAIGLRDRTILKQIPLGEGIEGIDVAPDHSAVYATSAIENKLFLIDPISLEVTKEVSTENSPLRVIARPNGREVLVVNAGSGTIQVFDAVTLELKETIKVGRQPIGVVVPNNKFAYIANMKDDTVSVINMETWKVEGELSTGNKPDGITYIPARSSFDGSYKVTSNDFFCRERGETIAEERCDVASLEISLDSEEVSLIYISKNGRRTQVINDKYVPIKCMPEFQDEGAKWNDRNQRINSFLNRPWNRGRTHYSP